MLLNMIIIGNGVHNIYVKLNPYFKIGRCPKMANIKSSKKRIRVSSTKSLANKSRKSNLKTVLKQTEIAVAENNSTKEEAIKLAIKKVDQAAAHGLMHKNCAARKKSQLAKKLNASV